MARVTGHAEHGLLGWLRRLAPLLSPLWILSFVLAEAPPYSGSFSSAVPIGLIGIVLATVAELVRARRSSRLAEVRLGGGFIEIGGRAGIAEKIIGRRLQGATTAGIKHATGRGQVVTLAGKRQTVSVEVSTSEEANRLRGALAIGHNGFGVVPWYRTNAALGIISAVLMCLMFIGAKQLHDFMLFWFGWAGFLLWRVVGFGHIKKPSVVLHPWGIESKGVMTRYEHIAELSRFPKILQLRLTNGARAEVGEGATAEELRVLEAQIKEARKRALGYGAPAPQIDHAIARLGEGDENATAWLQSLDVQSQRLLQAAGYRGGGGVTEDELWATLENHDASPDVRAAVARVLWRASKRTDKAERIDRAARSSREERTEKLIRVATEDDMHEAAAELEALHEEEARRRARV